MVFFLILRLLKLSIKPSALLLVLALALTGCGKSVPEKSDKAVKQWRVEIADASFPLKQRLAEPVEFKIEVRNAGETTIPELAVTIDSFNYRSRQRGLADPKRPVWTVDKPPPGSASADVNTYTLGRLKPGETAKAVWKLTAVRSGSYTVKYKVAGDTIGAGKTLLPDGTAPEGAFVVSVSKEPKPIEQ